MTDEEDPAFVAAQADEQSHREAHGCQQLVEKQQQQDEEEKAKKQLSTDLYYNYQDVSSGPSVTVGSEIPENLLHLSHSFGYDSRRRANLQLLDDRTLMFIAGNLLVLLDMYTAEQRYLRSCSGGGIGSITVHPRRENFVAAEKGNQPNILIYEYPSLRLYHILRGGTMHTFSSVQFNPDGTLLASVGGASDYTLTVWNWRQEEVVLRCKAISQEVYRVSFSPYEPGLLTTSGSGHIKFWKMASTFTGLKLQGHVGHFGTAAATDIDGYLELPDGRVVSGTEWGNLLLWVENAVKVEISRKEGRSCHAGSVQPFVLDDGQLMTFGSDGVVRTWDFESIQSANSLEDNNRFEMEPMNELLVGHNVCLCSVVKGPQPDSFIWFAQDSNGGIWKLDLSFTNTTPDPECLFSFHAGVIQGLDVSQKSHLMATTSLDRSVRVFDFLAKKELTCSRFNQGGTALAWAPPSVHRSGGLLIIGFEDGVVRLLQLYSTETPHQLTWPNTSGDVKLRLQQAFKPHKAAVTALSCERDILATGSSDCTVFFFALGETYSPIGFIHVPGPVQGLQWSPYPQSESRLIIFCQSGHVVEVHRPDPGAQKPAKTFQLLDLPRKTFRFKSIKSRIKREEEVARRQALKEEKKKRERRVALRIESEQVEENKQDTREEEEDEDEDEDEEELPPVHIPVCPSPIYCGFYSKPGHFWLSMGGFDSGYLYHCKFSEDQEEDPDNQWDEPFHYVPIENSDTDPIHSVTFSSKRDLLLCGMHSGTIRVYTLEPEDHRLSSMNAHWSLSVHDNQSGHLRHICCSHDDKFVLTAGDDGNIFSFSLLSPEELQRSLQMSRAKVPSPRVGLENEALAQDIEDPTADSIEMAKLNQEKNRLQHEAEVKMAAKRKKLTELQRTYRQLLNDNHKLPEHVQLKPEELLLDPCFKDQAEQEKSRLIMEVRKQLSWEEERSGAALKKLQDWFFASLETNIVTVVAISSDHRVSTYLQQPTTEFPTQHQHINTINQPDGDCNAASERRNHGARPVEDSDKKRDQEVEVLLPQVPPSAGVRLGVRQEEKLRRAAEKAEQARAKIEKRKKEWAKLHAEKPDENHEDPRAAQLIHEARENIGDLKLRTETDQAVPEHLRMNPEKKRVEIMGLEISIREQQTQMNSRIMALRDSKLDLVSRLQSQVQQLHKVQQRLPTHLHRPPPVLPTIQPEETPERRLQYDDSRLDQYRALREQSRSRVMGQEEDEEQTTYLLELLEKEIQEKGDQKIQQEVTHPMISPEEGTDEEEVELSDLEKELLREEEIRLLYEQDYLLEQINISMYQFDAELLLLRHQKLHLDWELKMADLRRLTLCQELLLLMEFAKREVGLQEALDKFVREENGITSRLDNCSQQLQQKHRDMSKLQEQEKAVVAAFQESLGQNNKFEAFLTGVFKRNVKYVKKQEPSEGEEMDSDEDSDAVDDDSDSGENAVQGCDPQLYENTLQLRERRLDVEALLMEEKRRAEALKEEQEVLLKKQKTARLSVKAAEQDLEEINREKQEKMNELEVVVPLRLHQIEFIANGSIPADLSEALVVDRSELRRLQQRIEQLHVERGQQKEAKIQVRRDHSRLIHECKELKTTITELEEQCDTLMMKKFGRLVDLEALQTLRGNRELEELKQQKVLQEARWGKEGREWEAKVEAAHDALMEVTRCNTELLARKKKLVEENMELKRKLETHQRKTTTQGALFQDHRRRVDQEEIRRLQTLVKKQADQAEAIRREIYFLSRKGGHVVPPAQATLPPLAPVTTSSCTGQTHMGNQGKGAVRQLKLANVQRSQK